MPPRIPTPQDFHPLLPHLHVSLVFPNPPESTTAILLLLHGLGDSEAPFATFARNLHLPGVLGVAVRGVNPVPPSLLGLPLDSGPTRHFHWGDDLVVTGTGELDPDPGFNKAEELVLGRLVREVLVGRCGWEVGDVMVFGFGQGGSVALGLAGRLREGERFKGVVSVGGGWVGSVGRRVGGKGRTPVLVCHGRESEVLDEEGVERVREVFEDVREVRWKRGDDGMPRSREEILPVMEFFAERLRAGWS